MIGLPSTNELVRRPDTRGNQVVTRSSYIVFLSTYIKSLESLWIPREPIKVFFVEIIIVLVVIIILVSSRRCVICVDGVVP